MPLLDYFSKKTASVTNQITQQAKMHSDISRLQGLIAEQEKRSRFSISKSERHMPMRTGKIRSRNLPMPSPRSSRRKPALTISTIRSEPAKE